MGRYQKPRELTAEVMFVDLRGSTGIAEALGHERYSSLLRDFFLDTSRAVHEARGEIYQYVGDEVVIVWPGARAAGRWLSCFSEMHASIVSRHDEYMARYGIVPEFKAGVHGGTVIVTEVGTLQRALVYHGDVLNTAARIQAKCNDVGCDLLTSEIALSRLTPPERARFEPVGPVGLRGKAETVHLYRLRRSGPSQVSA
jgi:adenylate cyclase